MGQLKIFSWDMGCPKIFTCSLGQLNQLYVCEKLPKYYGLKPQQIVMAFGQ